MRRALRIALPVAIVVVALAVGASGSDGPRSDPERAQAIAASVRCPTCAGQSVAASDAPAAEQIRAEIDRRVAAGESDDRIKASLVAAYGEGILLNPPASGVAGLVWVLPVAALVFAAGGLAMAFRRWRTVPADLATDDDRVLGAGQEAPKRARLALGALGVVAVGLAAGVAVANASGTRHAGETASGEIRDLTDDRLQEASDLARGGDVRGALELYDGVLEDDPANVEALAERGLLLASLSEAAELPQLLPEGRSSVERALEVDPGNPRSLFYLGLIQRLEGDEGAAAETLEEALASRPPPALRQTIERFLGQAGTDDGTG
ncbi:MAG: cytochrome c-type biogenesis protein CcmH [Acidimicrobiales bacterium]